MKKKILSLATLLTLSLTACNGNNSTSTSPNTSPISPTTTTGPISSSDPSSSFDFGSDIGPVDPSTTLSLQGQTSCNAGDTIELTATVNPSTLAVGFVSSDSKVATVDSKGVVTVSKNVTKVTVVTITAYIIDYPSVRKTLSITVNPVTSSFTAKATLTQIGNKEELTTIKENSGAYLLTVTSDDLPTGVKIEDCTFVWPSNSAFAAIEEGPQTDTANKRLYVVNYAGTHNFEIKVTYKGQTYTIHKSLTISRDDSLYKTIATPKEFISLFDKGGSIDGRYILGANLDLKGYRFSGATKNNVLNALIDGNGYTVRNFQVDCGQDGAAAGLVNVVAKSIIKNIHLQGKVNSPCGQGGLIAKELQAQAVMADCLIEAENIAQEANPSGWSKNGVPFAILKGTVENCVFIATSTSEDPSIKDSMFGAFPYAYHNGTDSFASATNIYTNRGEEYAGIIDASGSHQWGMLGAGDKHISITGDFNDFSASTKADFDLDPTIWTLEDGKMPVLAHYNDEFLTIEPTVTISASTNLKPNDVVELKINAADFDEEPQLTINLSEEGVISVAKDEESGKYMITALADGNCTIQVDASVGEELVVHSNELKIVVNSNGPTYEIPENAVEISSATELEAFFAVNNADQAKKNVVLTADIDYSSVGHTRLGLEGVPYQGIFEGQGHKITGLSTNRSLFHFLGQCEIRNVTIEAEPTDLGYPVLCLSNITKDTTTKLTNVTINVSITSSTPNNSIQVMFNQPAQGNIEINSCHVNFIVSIAGSNCMRPIAVNMSNITVTESTWSVTGVDEGSDVFESSGSVRANFVDHDGGMTYVANENNSDSSSEK